MANMNSLPVEIIEKILQYLTYQEMGRVIVVNKCWKSLIEGMLPTVRQLSIKDMGVSCLDEFRLSSTFKGNPLHKSRHLWTMNKKLKGVFLYRLDDNWFISLVPGVLDKGEGYLKSPNSLSAPPESEWKWRRRSSCSHPPRKYFKIKSCGVCCNLLDK